MLLPRFQDKEVVVVVSFLEIYCDQVRDLGEAYMSHGEREVDGLKTTSDIYRQMKSVRNTFLKLTINSHCICVYYPCALRSNWYSGVQVPFTTKGVVLIWLHFAKTKIVVEADLKFSYYRWRA